MLDIQNYYEQLVTEQLHKLAKHVKELTHKDFMQDVACLALNDLPTRYVRSLVDLHSHFSDLDIIEMNYRVEEAINKAVILVRQRSHHDRG